MQDTAAIVSLISEIGCPCLEHEPMKKHTSFKIGGPADLFVTPASEEAMQKVVELCRKEEIPLFVMGSGSNLLVSDDGVRGVVLHTGGLSDLSVSGCVGNCLRRGRAAFTALLCRGRAGPIRLGVRLGYSRQLRRRRLYERRGVRRGSEKYGHRMPACFTPDGRDWDAVWPAARLWLSATAPMTTTAALSPRCVCS